MPQAAFGHNVYKCYYCAFIAFNETGTAWPLYLQHLSRKHKGATLWRITLRGNQTLPVRQ